MSKIDNTISKMEGYINEIKEEANKHFDKLPEESKNQIVDIASRTINTIEKSIVKLKDMALTVSNEDELDDFLARLEEKCKDVTDFTKTKINELVPLVRNNLNEMKDSFLKDFDETKKNVGDKAKEFKKNADYSFEKFVSNENVKNVIKLIKNARDKAIEFYNDPKTQKAINEAKLKVIELAEKGLENLKDLLERNEDNNEND